MQHKTSQGTKSKMRKLFTVVLALLSIAYDPVSAAVDEPPIYFGFERYIKEDSLNINLPTSSPTFSPSELSSSSPSSLSAKPSLIPSRSSTPLPTTLPSAQPTVTASNIPTELPTPKPSPQPTVTASTVPSKLPTSKPSSQPTVEASIVPTELPTSKPSSQPTVTASTVSTEFPTTKPSSQPTVTASTVPTELPTTKLSSQPTVTASTVPTELPTNKPSPQPTVTASTVPTELPTSKPSSQPSAMHSSVPTATVSSIPSSEPSATASSKPSGIPTAKPSKTPTYSPSVRPTSQPSLVPTFQPSTIPSVAPSQNPSDTNVEMYQAKLDLVFDIFTAPMFSNETMAFEKIVVDFINSTKTEVDNVDITIESASVIAQSRRQGESEGLMSIVDWTPTTSPYLVGGPRRSLASSNKKGIFIEMLVSGVVSYGTLPENFSFADSIGDGVRNNFENLTKEVNDKFKTYDSAVGGGSNSGVGTTGNKKKTDNMILYITVACVGGCMIIATAMILIRRRRLTERRNQLYQEYDQNSVVAECEDDFLHSQSSLQNQELVEKGVWADPSENYGKKDLRNPYSNVGQAYSFSDDDALPKPSMRSDLSESDQETPTGSASSNSLGINVSPEAMYEARKQHQPFSFIPEGSEAMSISHSYADKNGRLVYKSYVSFAPKGALGIIIDTTAEGPMVHAIKPTSQLLGTVAPGDIVVGLDNIETRQMTAPALTRLMARKAQQHERKITFLRPMSS